MVLQVWVAVCVEMFVYLCCFCVYYVLVWINGVARCLNVCVSGVCLWWFLGLWWLTPVFAGLLCDCGYGC